MAEQRKLDDGAGDAEWRSRESWMTEQGMLDGGAEKAGWRSRESGMMA